MSAMSRLPDVRAQIRTVKFASGYLLNLNRQFRRWESFSKLPQTNGFACYADNRAQLVARQIVPFPVFGDDPHGTLLSNVSLDLSTTDCCVPNLARNGTLRAMKSARERPDKIKRQFAARLEAVRIASGYRSKKAFAEALGIESETYRRYERAETEPNLETLAKISLLTQKSLDFLILGVPEPGDGKT